MTSQGKKKQLVAIIDDDVELCSLVGGILEDHDYEVMTFADPFEALYSMPKLLPDVVISDINMPKMDGYTFRQRFLEDEHLRDIPWIFLTARRSPEQRVEGIESGSDAYVTKPFLPRELVAIVKNVIQRLRKNRPLPEIDPVTHCYSRDFLERVPALLESTHPASTVCAMIEIDQFKKISDGFGRPSGEMVLSAVADIIHQNMRREDILVRYGEEEFFLILSGKDLAAGALVVERIRKNIASEVFENSSGLQKFHVTVSAGVSLALPGRPLNDVVREADARLHYAQSHGHDQVAVAM